MASILKVNTLTGASTAGSIAVTGEGNSTTTNLQQGLIKAWVNFNGTSTIAISDSMNVTSITDRGTGLYTVTINNDMGNANFATCGSSRKTDANEDPNQTTTYHAGTGYTKVVGEVRIATGRGADEYDTPSSEVIVFGDLA